MYRIYQIGNEKTLSEIAGKFNTTEDYLKQINGITDNYMVGMGGFIIVPAMMGNENFEKYIVKPGDTIYAIARKYNVDYNDLLNLNGLDKDQYIYPNQEIMLPKEGVKFVITKDNDTLNMVANSLNMTPEEIIRQNEIIYLVPDQLIVYKKRD